MTKIVINNCFGGFWLTDRASELYKKYRVENGKGPDDQPRDAPELVRVVEELHALRVNPGTHVCRLKIVEIPDGVEWEIDDYDGVETIHEVHRTWSN